MSINIYVMNEQIDKMWSLQSMKYSVIKTRKYSYKLRYKWTSKTLYKWKKPNTKAHIFYDSFSVKCLEKASPQGQKVQWWLPRAGRWEWGVTETAMRLLSGAMTIFYNQTVVMLVQLCDFTKNHVLKMGEFYSVSIIPQQSCFLKLQFKYLTSIVHDIKTQS